MTESLPEISVVIAVYNSEKYITPCVESILNQTFGDFELVIVDDGSSDSTRKILRSIAGRDPRIKLLENDRNRGIAYSRNKAVENSSGEYVAIMDADDIASPDRLEKQLDFLRAHPEYAGCGSMQDYIDDKGEPFDIREVPQKRGEVTGLLSDPCELSHSTCMFRRDVLMEVGGYRETFRRAVDYDLFLRITEKYRVYNIPEVLLHQRFSIDRGTVKDRRRQLLYTEFAQELAFQRQKDGMDALQAGDKDSFMELKNRVFGVAWKPRFMEVSSNYLYWARRMYHRGPISYARKLAWKSIIYDPFNVVAWFYAIYLYMGKGLRVKLAGLKNVILR